MDTPTVALLGLGEAGAAFAADLVAVGAVVRGYDPAVTAPDGVLGCPSEADAVAGADLVLSVNSAAAAPGALRAGIGALGAGAVWVDANTTAPEVKEQLDRTARDHGHRCVDVALMATVPGRGLGVPMFASGPGAERAAAVLRPLGTPVEVLDGPAGVAAGRKLLRSVFFKGMAAAVVEALAAARAAGCEDWLRDDIATELADADESTVDRLVSGSHTHAVRRGAEMDAAAAMLDDLGVPPTVTRAGRELLRGLGDS